MGALPKTRMTSGEYLDWARMQADGRFELIGGEVVAMSPETVRHVRMKNEIWLSLRNAIGRSGRSCTAYGDGVGIKIDEQTVREPDVSVQCKASDQDSLLLDEPVIVVEVVSLSSVRSDTGAKVAEYFRVPSICHYLIVDPFNLNVIHHARPGAEDAIRTSILTRGQIDLTPPGFTVQVADLLGGARLGSEQES